MGSREIGDVLGGEFPVLMAFVPGADGIVICLRHCRVAEDPVVSQFFQILDDLRSGPEIHIGRFEADGIFAELSFYAELVQDVIRLLPFEREGIRIVSAVDHFIEFISHNASSVVFCRIYYTRISRALIKFRIRIHKTVLSQIVEPHFRQCYNQHGEIRRKDLHASYNRQRSLRWMRCLCGYMPGGRSRT